MHGTAVAMKNEVTNLQSRFSFVVAQKSWREEPIEPVERNNGLYWRMCSSFQRLKWVFIYLSAPGRSHHAEDNRVYSFRIGMGLFSCTAGSSLWMFQVRVKDFKKPSEFFQFLCRLPHNPVTSSIQLPAADSLLLEEINGLKKARVGFHRDVRCFLHWLRDFERCISFAGELFEDGIDKNGRRTFGRSSVSVSLSRMCFAGCFIVALASSAIFLCTARL